MSLGQIHKSETLEGNRLDLTQFLSDFDTVFTLVIKMMNPRAVPSVLITEIAKLGERGHRVKGMGGGMAVSPPVLIRYWSGLHFGDQSSCFKVSPLSGLVPDHASGRSGSDPMPTWPWE